MTVTASAFPLPVPHSHVVTAVPLAPDAETEAGDPARTLLVVVPWEDPVVDQRGYDPRSPYVERFWLGVLGPSSTWLVRRLVRGFDANPQGFRIDLGETARALGLGAGTGPQSSVSRALNRCCQFGVARRHGVNAVAVRRRLPPLSRRQLVRLPPAVRQAHDRWTESELVSGQRGTEERARRLALTLVELGEDAESTAHQLERWRFEPTVSQEAATWATSRQATGGDRHTFPANLVQAARLVETGTGSSDTTPSSSAGTGAGSSVTPPVGTTCADDVDPRPVDVGPPVPGIPPARTSSQK